MFLCWWLCFMHWKSSYFSEFGCGVSSDSYNVEWQPVMLMFVSCLKDVTYFTQLLYLAIELQLPNVTIVFYLTLLYNVSPTSNIVSWFYYNNGLSSCVMVTVTDYHIIDQQNLHLPVKVTIDWLLIISSPSYWNPDIANVLLDVKISAIILCYISYNIQHQHTTKWPSAH